MITTSLTGFYSKFIRVFYVRLNFSLGNFFIGVSVHENIPVLNAGIWYRYSEATYSSQWHKPEVEYCNLIENIMEFTKKGILPWQICGMICLQ